MGKGNSAGKENASQRFMRATGRLRAIFGPANRSSLGHDMTEENRMLLALQPIVDTKTREPALYKLEKLEKLIEYGALY